MIRVQYEESEGRERDVKRRRIRLTIGKAVFRLTGREARDLANALFLHTKDVGKKEEDEEDKRACRVLAAVKLAGRLQGRVFNWKFRQACRYLRGAKTKEARGTICSLAIQYEDFGWRDGPAEDVRVIRNAVRQIYRCEEWVGTPMH
jgi:hypothetical protein